MGEGLAKGLRARGVGELDACLAAEAGIAVFRVALGLWLGESEKRGFRAIVDAALSRLSIVITAK
jgi:hypothetical protein